MQKNCTVVNEEKNGDPYIYHLLSTAYFLAQMQMGPKTIIAGDLHDIVEDTPVTIKEPESIFGEEVANLVESVTMLLDHAYQQSLKQSQEMKKLHQ
ncbi:HD domain-containing protein [Mesoplasma photuris]|uniref:HD domain-containing protein n=1 Tax=Mesoplasma photuris TaxID=217731 RepID=UPI00146FBE85|nr:HD domain-containing protein [Mesoplasma photuris]